MNASDLPIVPPRPCPRCERSYGEWQPHASPRTGGFDHFRCGGCGHVWPVRKEAQEIAGHA